MPLQEMLAAAAEAKRAVEKSLDAKSLSLSLSTSRDPRMPQTGLASAASWQWDSFWSEGARDEDGWRDLQDNDGEEMGHGDGSGVERLLDIERARGKVGVVRVWGRDGTRDAPPSRMRSSVD
jgi:hypothetical protein